MDASPQFAFDHPAHDPRLLGRHAVEEPAQSGGQERREQVGCGDAQLSERDVGGTQLGKGPAQGHGQRARRLTVGSASQCHRSTPRGDQPVSDQDQGDLEQAGQVGRPRDADAFVTCSRQAARALTDPGRVGRRPGGGDRSPWRRVAVAKSSRQARCDGWVWWIRVADPCGGRCQDDVPPGPRRQARWRPALRAQPFEPSPPCPPAPVPPPVARTMGDGRRTLLKRPRRS